jgi:hypothetical protein
LAPPAAGGGEAAELLDCRRELLPLLPLDSRRVLLLPLAGWAGGGAGCQPLLP